MRNQLLTCLLFLLFAQWLPAQPPGTVSARIKARQEAEKQPFEESYENRIRQAVLYGVYIPKDLRDAFDQLNQITDEASRQKFSNMPEVDAQQKLHFSLGRWIILNWGFYQGSRLSKYLNDIGIHEPDDMARFIIITYHRELNARPLGVKELVEGFKEKRRLEQQRKLETGTIIHQETRIRPTKQENE